MSEKEIKKVEDKKDSIEGQIDGIAAQIMDKVSPQIEAMLKENKKSNKSSTKEFTSEKDVEKKTSEGSIDGMGKKEKVFTFIKALVNNDQPVVKMFNERARQKALAEGVAISAGNLIPQEMHELILKDLNAPHRQRSLVKTVRMRTNVRTFNVEANTVQVYATGEAATSKINRIKEIVQSFIKKMVNSEKLLNRTTLSQAKAVMPWKVQRIENPAY